MAEDGDAKLTDLLVTLADCPKARSINILRPIVRRGMSVIKRVEGSTGEPPADLFSHVVRKAQITIWRVATMLRLGSHRMLALGSH